MRIPVDLHIHTCLSPCGDDSMTPNNIVRMAAIKELACIAITDHNAGDHAALAQQLGREWDVLVVPGVEVTTQEEVHTLCYFENPDTLMAFCDWQQASMPPVRNREDIFGHQVVVDAEDQVVGGRENLLILAGGYSLEEVEAQCLSMGGVMVPAHINRSSNSLLRNLGLIPPSLAAKTVEVYGEEDGLPVEGFRVIHSSDAHYLENILEPEFFLDVPELSVPAILDVLRRGKE